MSAEERTAGYENGIGAMTAEERTAAGKKGYENRIGGEECKEYVGGSHRMGEEVLYYELKRCVEIPERGTPLQTWLSHQLSNTHVSCLNAKIRKEIEENEGSTWSERRVKLCDCVEQKIRAKKRRINK